MDLTYTAFRGHTFFAAGPLDTLLPTLKAEFDRDPGSPVLLFEDQTGKQVDFDLRGPAPSVLERYRTNVPRTGTGRPKLGVTSREVTLLPKHWEWLETQPNGASAALRRLVESAMKNNPEKQRTRERVEAVGRFLSAMAGNLPAYEEATRALYAHDRKQFEALTAEWPADVRKHALSMIQDSF